MVKGKGTIAGVVAATAAALAVAAPAHAATRVIAVDGVSKQRADLRVEILVQVKAGQSARAVADNALAAQGAKRAPAPDSQAFTKTGPRSRMKPARQTRPTSWWRNRSTSAASYSARVRNPR